VLGDALGANPPDLGLVDAATRTTGAAVRLATSELSTASWDARRLSAGLSHAVFEWGCRLDGSQAANVAELDVDVRDGGRSLTRWAKLMASVVRPRDRLLAERLERAVRELEAWLDRRVVASRAKATRLTCGELGAALRAAAPALGEQPVRPPFLARHRTQPEDWQEPIHVATFPALIGPRPRPERVELGASLFFDPRLSKGKTLSCASCHRVERGFSAGPRRPPTAAGTPVARDVPGLWNAAYEPMYFWDGRASTLADQARIDVEPRWRDADDVVARLREDAELVAAFRRAFTDGLSARKLARAPQTSSAP
jgi:hypothetical protein